MDKTIQGMEEDMRRHRQGDFFKKMKQLQQQQSDTSRHHTRWGWPTSPEGRREAGTLKRHFEGVLNVQSTVAEDVLAGLVDHSQVDEPEVTREEVEKAVSKLQNGKSAYDRIVAELLKNGREAGIDCLLQTVWRSRQVPSEWKSFTLLPLYKKW